VVSIAAVDAAGRGVLPEELAGEALDSVGAARGRARHGVQTEHGDLHPVAGVGRPPLSPGEPELWRQMRREVAKELARGDEVAKASVPGVSCGTEISAGNDGRRQPREAVGVRTFGSCTVADAARSRPPE
jgi:hypothetical protein